MYINAMNYKLHYIYVEFQRKINSAFISFEMKGNFLKRNHMSSNFPLGKREILEAKECNVVCFWCDAKFPFKSKSNKGNIVKSSEDKGTTKKTLLQGTMKWNIRHSPYLLEHKLLLRSDRKTSSKPKKTVAYP